MMHVVYGFIGVFANSMARKFRLHVKKRQYRQKSKELIVRIPLIALRSQGQSQSLVIRPRNMLDGEQPLADSIVSLPLSATPLPPFSRCIASIPGQNSELTVSLPLSYFSSLPLASLSELHSRLLHLQAVPGDWCDTSSGSESMTLCRIVGPQAAALPKIDFTVIIDKSLAWKLFFFDQRLEADRCPVFVNIPPIVTSPTDVVKLLSAIDSSAVCIGNPDEKFLPLVKRHQGHFVNSTG